MTETVSHAIVLPDVNFDGWLDAVRQYMQTFPRVAVVRSAGGNDLNRFHTVTAVQAPGMWFDDDALYHIRRAFPMVVRVDVIDVDQPDQLKQVLAERVRTGDRYGESLSGPTQLDERFILEWPTAARPARILRGFNAPSDPGEPHEGIVITASPGGNVHAAAPGTVQTVFNGRNDALRYGAYVQVASWHNDQQYTVTYGGLDDIQVHGGQQVAPGDVIGTAAEAQVKLVVQNPTDGISGFQLENVIDPKDMIYWNTLRVRPNVGALRVRNQPGTYGEIIGLVTSSDMLETGTTHGRTLLKVGREGEWLRVRYAAHDEAYCGAYYLDAYGEDDPVEAIAGVKLPGMNLDIDHRLGTPEPPQLRELGWVRLLYNVSLNPNKHEGDPARHGNVDLDFTFDRYHPFLERYANAGLQVILVLNHQTFGEGQGYVWPQMSNGDWHDLINKYTDVVKRIAAQFRGTGLVYAFQIWNEQDTQGEGRAAVPIPPEHYGNMLAKCLQAIREVNDEVKIITGGHISGPDKGPDYARKTLEVMPGGVRPDGIAFHPYGRGPRDNRFTSHGHIGEAVRKYARVMPGTPLWITEWGVLDRQGDDSIVGEVTRYASGFLDNLKHRFPGQVAAAIWYAWADGMDNGYGLVRADGQPRQPLYDKFLSG